MVVSNDQHGLECWSLDSQNGFYVRKEVKKLHTKF